MGADGRPGPVRCAAGRRRSCWPSGISAPCWAPARQPRRVAAARRPSAWPPRPGCAGARSCAPAAPACTPPSGSAPTPPARPPPPAGARCHDHPAARSRAARATRSSAPAKPTSACSPRSSPTRSSRLAVCRWLIPDGAARRAAFPGYFRLYVEHAMADGLVETTPDRAAAALWIPGDRAGRAARRVRRAAGRHHRPAGSATSWPSMSSWTVTTRPAPSTTTWPSSPSARTGRARAPAPRCCTPTTPVLDDRGTPAYLEASDERTRGLYLPTATPTGQPDRASRRGADVPDVARAAHRRSCRITARAGKGQRARRPRRPAAPAAASRTRGLPLARHRLAVNGGGAGTPARAAASQARWKEHRLRYPRAPASDDDQEQPGGKPPGPPGRYRAARQPEER